MGKWCVAAFNSLVYDVFNLHDTRCPLFDFYQARLHGPYRPNATFGQLPPTHVFFLVRLLYFERGFGQRAWGLIRFPVNKVLQSAGAPPVIHLAH